MENTPVKPKRYLWIDYARFLCIAYIVFFHIPIPLPFYVRWSLYLFQMPAFIFIAGLTFRFEKYPDTKQYIKHRSKQLLIPYFSFILLFYLLWLVSRVVFHKGDPSIPLWQPLTEAVLGKPQLVCAPLWFIACLFMLQCVFYLIFRWIKNRYIALPLLCVITYIPVLVDIWTFPWMLALVCVYMPFYGVSVYFKKEIHQLMESSYRYLIALCCIIVHIILVYYWVDMKNHYLSHLIRITGGFLILFPFCVLSKLIADIFGKTNFVEMMTKNGVVILACHLYAITVLLAVFRLEEVSMAGNYLMKFILAVITVLSMLIPINLINRYVPFILGRPKSAAGLL